MNKEQLLLGPKKDKGFFLNETQKIEEKKYEAGEAAGICMSQMALRNSILEKINDYEWCNNLLNNLYTLEFRNMDKDLASGHIMYRVLVGTIIDEIHERNRKFIFDHTDIKIARLFQEIVSILNNGDLTLKQQKASIEDAIKNKYPELKSKGEVIVH